MSSGEERLEEMLKAVMGTGDAAIPDENDPGMTDQNEESLFAGIPDDLDGMEDDILAGIPDDLVGDILNEMPDVPEDDILNGISDVPVDDIPDGISDVPEDDILSGMSDGSMDDILNGISAELPDELSEMVSEEIPGSEEEEMLIDPLALLGMSEEEIDQVLEKEAGIGDAVLGRREPTPQEDKDLSELLGEDDALSDIQELFSMSENHEQVSDEAIEDFSFGDVDLDSESVQDMLGLTPGAEEDFLEEPEEEAPAAAPEKKPEKEKRKKEKRPKKEKKASGEGKENKEGFGKKLARLFFGSDDDELDSEEDKVKNAGAEKDDQADAKDKKANVKAEKKAKKKKPAKKKEADPKKAAKEKQKKAQNAEKAKKKAEKAEKAEKERRAAKKLPKKKVIVWVLFCASIAAGILLMNSVGMNTLHLTEARNAFYDKDYETAYKLLNGGELAEEDQVIFQQSSAILHLRHAKEAYENHLKLEKPVMALEDLLKGVGKYQGLLESGQENLITPELTAQYQAILKILQDKYSLSEEGALEINALKDDYEFSLQLEALVNGEIYQSRSEMEQQEEEAAANYPELEDILPEEEEYLNDSSN